MWYPQYFGCVLGVTLHVDEMPIGTVEEVVDTLEEGFILLLVQQLVVVLDSQRTSYVGLADVVRHLQQRLEDGIVHAQHVERLPGLRHKQVRVGSFGNGSQLQHIHVLGDQLPSSVLLLHW